MKQSICVLLCIMLTTLTSCNSIEKSDVQENSILADNPCSAPCWQNIKIGETSKEETMAQLQQLSFIDSINNITIYTTYLGDGIETPHDGVQAKCKEPRDKTCALIAFNDDKVASITLFPNYKMTFREYVQYIGNPDEVIFYQPDMSSNQSIHFSCEIELSWKIKLVQISYAADNNNQKCEDFKENKQPDPDFEIYAIDFYSKPVDSFARAGDVSIYPWIGFSTK